MKYAISIPAAPPSFNVYDHWPDYRQREEKRIWQGMILGLVNEKGNRAPRGLEKVFMRSVITFAVTRGRDTDNYTVPFYKWTQDALVLSGVLVNDTAELLTKGAAEVSIEWTDKDRGIACKGRMDWLTDTALVDLKTTRDIEVKAFGRHAGGMGYHCQLAFYQMGLFAHGLEPATKIIAVESCAPYDVAVFDLNEDVLWAGEVKVRQALALVARCREQRRWPGRYQEEASFMLPAWEFPGEDAEDEAIGGRP